MFVNCFLLYRGSSDIEKFRLRCLEDDHQFPLVDGWIRSAIMRNAVEFDLDVPERSQMFELPRSLFVCKRLRVLKLMSSFVINTPKSWCLPSLKVLVVTFDCPDIDPIRELLPCCPAVEDFTIRGRVAQRVVLNIHISSPELKTLKIALETREDGHFLGESACSLTIRAPKLEDLDIKEGVLSLYILKAAKSITKASIHLSHLKQRDDPAFTNRAAALVAQICNVKYLSLSAHCLEACLLPTFQNLRHLKLVLHEYYSWWADWLNRSPNLESLVLDHACFKLRHHYGCMNSCQIFPCLYKSPESVCSSSSSYLKIISIMNSSRMENGMEVSKYLLERGEVSKSLTLYTTRHVCTELKL